MQKNSHTLIYIFLGAFLIAAIIVLYLVLKPTAATNSDTQQMTNATSSTFVATTTEQTPVVSSPTAEPIQVTMPVQGQTISSPLTIKGQAVGTWYFEASFPVELQDAQGNIVAQGHASAQGDWMTTSLVPFTATLTFTTSQNLSGQKGTLVLKNDNPSGLPQNDKSFSIPIMFPKVSVAPVSADNPAGTSVITSIGNETFGSSIQYSCADGKTFTARFATSRAEVTQGAATSLLQQVSSDDENGTQFKAQDQNLVLWVKEENAFLMQNGTTTYASCRAL